MADEKLITLNNLDRFKKKYDTHLENGGVEVGVAKQLKNVSEESGSLQDAPFVFQATGTDNNTTETPTAPIAKHLQLRGNSVAFNQFARELNNTYWYTNYGSSSYSDNVCSYTNTSLNDFGGIEIRSAYFGFFVPNHKYLVKVYIKSSTATLTVPRIYLGNVNSGNLDAVSSNYKCYSSILTPTSTGELLRLIFRTATSQETATFDIKDFQCFDLTLLGKDYTSVLAFNRDYSLPYYSYNAGALLDCNSQALETTGFNQFDGEIESGYIDATGNKNNNNRARSKNFIGVIAGHKYTFEEHSTLTYSYFWLGEYDGSYNLVNQDTYSATVDRTRTITLKNNTRYVRIYYIYNSDVSSILSQIKVCVYLYWDGSRTGYESYVKHTYQLPQMSKPYSAGNIANTLDSDGTEITRVEKVNLWELDGWSYAGGNQDLMLNANALASLVKLPATDSTNANIKCSVYITSNTGAVYPKSVDKSICITTTGRIYIWDSSANITSSSTDETIKAYLQSIGAVLNYELATPTTEQTDKTFTENIIVDDFGTMRFVPVETESASNPIVPQGNQFFYPADYVLLIDDLNTYVDGAVSNLALKGDLQSGEPSTIEEVNDNVSSLYAIMQENVGGALRHQLADKASIDFNNTKYIDLGSITGWSYSSSSQRFSATISDAKGATGGNIANAICPKYKTVTGNTAYNGYAGGNDKCFGIFDNGGIYLIDTTLGTDASKLPTLLKGILLAYEKA